MGEKRGILGAGRKKIRPGKGTGRRGLNVRHVSTHTRIRATCPAGVISFDPYNDPAKQIVSLPIL